MNNSDGARRNEQTMIIKSRPNPNAPKRGLQILDSQRRSKTGTMHLNSDGPLAFPNYGVGNKTSGPEFGNGTRHCKRVVHQKASKEVRVAVSYVTLAAAVARADEDVVATAVFFPATPAKSRHPVAAASRYPAPAASRYPAAAADEPTTAPGRTRVKSRNDDSGPAAAADDEDDETAKRVGPVSVKSLIAFFEINKDGGGAQ